MLCCCADSAAGTHDVHSSSQIHGKSRWALGGLQGIGDRMSGAYDTAMKPSETFMRVGAMNEDLAGKYAQEMMDKFNETKMAPIDAAATANSIFTGSGKMGGKSSSTTSTPTNWGSTAAGYGTAALGAGK